MIARMETERISCTGVSSCGLRPSRLVPHMGV